MALGLTQPLTEMSTRNISWRKRWSVHRADNLTTYVCRLSWNLGVSTSWNPQGLSRPVMGLLYFYLLYHCSTALVGLGLIYKVPATSRKVAASIPDGVTGILHRHNPSGRTIALGLTKPLTEISTRNISWGKRWSVRRADNLTTFMCRLSWNLGASTSWNPQGLSRTVMGLLSTKNSIQTPS